MLILPVISVLMIYINIGLYKKFIRKEQADGTLSMLYSISISTLIILAANETLSLFHAIHYISLLLLWFIVDILLLFLCIFIIRKYRVPLSEIKYLFIFSKSIFNPIDIIVLIVCGAAIYMSARTVPYNWDSMTYHLTRIAHWVQNGSVAHYVCHDISQISAPPLAEFVVLHIYILSGCSDYFVNLLQTFSYLVSIFLVYKISDKIGCNRFFGSLAALIFATSPIVFGEALSTQVDMYSGMWLMFFVYLSLYFTDIKSKLQWNLHSISRLILMGMSAGFAYLAKPSVCIATFVFVIWILIVCIIRKDKLALVVKCAISLGLIALIIVLPEMIRNFITFHSISSSETSTEFLVSSYAPGYLFWNLVNNIKFNLSPRNLSMHHDNATNPLIIGLMLLAIVCGIMIEIKKRLKGKPGIELKMSESYTVASIVSMLIFCTVVQWYPFITRYEIGYLALLSPAVMIVFQYVFDNRKALQYVFAAAIIAISIVTFLVGVRYHSGFLAVEGKRFEQYFAGREKYEFYKEISDDIIENKYESVGFLCGNDSYEYPLWKMLENSMSRFEHVIVDNETTIYDNQDFLPDCIISVDVEPDDEIICHGIAYQLVRDVSGVKLFVH